MKRCVDMGEGCDGLQWYKGMERNSGWFWYKLGLAVFSLISHAFDFLGWLFLIPFLFSGSQAYSKG